MKETKYRMRLTIRILQIIRARTKADPILCRVIAPMVGVSCERIITGIIEELKDTGEWICASQKEPRGYYYAKSKAELNEYLEKEKNRCLEQLARHKKQREFAPPPMELFEIEETG